MQKLGRDLGMRRFQAVIAHSARRRQSKMHHRRPAFQLVMAVAMKQVRSPNRDTSSPCLDCRKRSVIIHDLIGEQDFIVTAPPQVQGRKIIKRPRRSNTCKQPVILLVPEAVLLSLFRGLRLASIRYNDW